MAPRSRLHLVAVLLALSVPAAGCGASVTINRDGVAPEATASPDQDERDDAEGSDSSSSVDTTDELFAGRVAWEEASCEFDEPPDLSVSCGWLEVPERWEAADDSATVRLHVGVFSAGPAAGAPLVYLEGGPGGDALANIDQNFDAIFGPFVDDHDVVVVGQRGTGSADPHLQCDEVLEVSLDLLDEAASLEEESEAYGPAFDECANRLRADDVDTSAYNSVQNAHDMEALRLALGHDEWNVLGISYGTRLAQTLMRLHPDGLRAVILDSVVAMDRDPSIDIPVVAKRAFETLWAGCESSAACAQAYPDLEARFFAMVEQLDREPVTFQVSNLLTGEVHDAALNGDGLMGQAFEALYSQSAFAALPETIAQLEVGETAAVEALLSQGVTSEEFLAIGMFWSVECHEEVPFITPESVAASTTGDPRYDRLNPPDPLAEIEAICSSFDAGEAPPVENEPVSSALPVLVLAGAYDPITPPADGEGTLAGFPNGFFYEYPHTGHAAVVDECAAAMSLAFLADPTSAPDDTCIAGVAEPVWTPDVFSSVELEPFAYEGTFAGASGLRPSGWEDLGDGITVWQDNAAHVSVVLQQVAAAVPVELLVDNLGSSVGAEPRRLDDVAAGDKNWQRHELVIPGAVIDLFVAEADGRTFLVMFQNAPGDRDAALEALAEPVLAAIEP